jgi:hypothetical protein
MNQSSLVDKFVKGGTKGSASNMFVEGNVLYSYGHHFPMLVRTSFGYLLNADKYSSTTSSHQSGCMKHATIQIPFSVLRAAGIITNYGSGWGFDEAGIQEVQIVKAEKQRWDWTGRWVTGYGKDQKVITNTEYNQLPEAEKETYNKQEERRPESAIIKANGKFFLSSMDGWNYFMVELPSPATEIAEAFEMLKPQEVTGKEYVRQGEWFFVETSAPATLLWQSGEDKKMYKQMAQKFELPKKLSESNSHIATRGCQIEDKLYVSGQVRHVTRFGGRGEHRMLTLSHADEPKIFLAYENRAVASYSASGRVD